MKKSSKILATIYFVIVTVRVYVSMKDTTAANLCLLTLELLGSHFDPNFNLVSFKFFNLNAKHLFL